MQPYFGLSFCKDAIELFQLWDGTIYVWTAS